MSTSKTTLAAALATLATIIAGLTALRTQLEQALKDETAQVAGAPAPQPAAAGKVAAVDAGRPTTQQPPASTTSDVYPTTLPTKFSIGSQSWFSSPSWGGSWPFKGHRDSSNNWVSDVNFAAVAASGGSAGSFDIFNPQYLADIREAGYTTYRHMDSNATNNSRVVTWAQRRQPGDANQEAYGAPDGSGAPGWAYEWQVELCNQANVDCWMTVPHQADDAHVTALAALIRQRLKPGLRVYVEYSNEVWNGQFSQFNYAIAQGAAQGLPGSNQWYKAIAFEMYRSLQIFAKFQQIFGASAMGSKVVRVFSTSGNLDLSAQAFANVYRSAQWNPTGQKIDMLALAPYIGSGTNGSSETLTRWKSEVDSKVSGEPFVPAMQQAGWDVATRKPKAGSIPLIGCYESGMHHQTNAHVFAASQTAYDAYRYMYDRFSTTLNGPCNQYTQSGDWNSGGAWGAKRTVGQDLSSAPKARAIRDWVLAHP